MIRMAIQLLVCLKHIVELTQLLANQCIISINIISKPKSRYNLKKGRNSFENNKVQVSDDRCPGTVNYFTAEGGLVFSQRNHPLILSIHTGF